MAYQNTFSAQPTWSGCDDGFPGTPVRARVDSELLDEELLDLLSKQVGDGLKLLGAHLKEDWAAEIALALRLALWKLSIWDHGASYGANLQGLKYVDARSTDVNSPRDATRGQKAAYGLITVVGRYAWKRWSDWLTSRDAGYDLPSPRIQHLNRLTNTLTTTHEIASFSSFLVFLYNGRYRTLTDRILRMRLVPSTNQTNREVSFEYLNRQLVWHAFTEFLLFLLPLVGISRWRRWVNKAWKKLVQYFTRMRQGRRASMAIAEELEHKGELAYLPERTCPICYQDQNPSTGQSEQDVINAGSNSGIIGSAATDITNPYETIPCGCVYCYICLTQRIEAEEGEGFTCLRCGEPAVKSCKPWNGDVLEETDFRPTNFQSSALERSESIPRPPSRKSVAFADDLEESGINVNTDYSDNDSMRSGMLSPVEPMPVDDREDQSPWSRFDDEEESAEED
ncbi:hypothetical protein AMS68_005274 [Peltaster fructicola]|uniref:Pex N-terminal domain-containing protein n=1 Tax=Peltaster fructicola TaxID=286661 RepID=A0A6H0XYA5_9PEZI|nr:hypothetical protein AMS68_005274 [Peltaster fructicola]